MHRKTPMRSTRQLSRLWCLLPLATALLLSACGRGDPNAAPAAAASATTQRADAPVLLLSPEDLRTLAASRLASGPVVSGSLQPSRRADLRAEVGALVQRVLKENGEPVKAGDLLVQLDDAAIRDSLTSANASVRAASQAAEQSERQVQRLKTLQTQGMTSMQALEDAEIRRNSARSELVAAQARVASAQQQLRRTEVRAPFAGIVSERKVSAGDTAQIGKELVKVIDPRTMRFEGLVSADRLHELKPGQPVSFRVNGYAEQRFDGRLRHIDATANASTRQVAVIVDFADPAAAPQVAGLFAEGHVETGGTQALMLAESSLQRAGETAFAWRVDGPPQARKLTKVSLELGPRDARSGEFPVRTGLAAGDVVLRNPGSTLKDGQKVDLAAPPAAPSPTAAASAAK